MPFHHRRATAGVDVDLNSSFFRFFQFHKQNSTQFQTLKDHDVTSQSLGLNFMFRTIKTFWVGHLLCTPPIYDLETAFAAWHDLHPYCGKRGRKSGAAEETEALVHAGYGGWLPWPL